MVVLGYVVILSFQLLNASLSMLYKNVYPKAFSNDPDVIVETSSLFGMFFAYTVFDGAKAIGMALLRSTGRPKITVAGVAIAQFAVAFPLVLLLRSKLVGIWWGMTSAWACCSLLFFSIIFLSDWDVEVARAQREVQLGLMSRDPERSQDEESTEQTDDELINEQL
jgi:Na+-driven multidrug efflux pump